MSQKDLEALVDLLGEFRELVQRQQNSWTQPELILNSITLIKKAVYEEISDREKQGEEIQQKLSHWKQFLEIYKKKNEENIHDEGASSLREVNLGQE